MDEVDQRYDLAKIFDRDLIHQTIFPMLKSVLVGVYVCVGGGCDPNLCCDTGWPSSI